MFKCHRSFLFLHVWLPADQGMEGTHKAELQGNGWVCLRIPFKLWTKLSWRSCVRLYYESYNGRYTHQGVLNYRYICHTLVQGRSKTNQHKHTPLTPFSSQCSYSPSLRLARHLSIWISTRLEHWWTSDTVFQLILPSSHHACIVCLFLSHVTRRGMIFLIWLQVFRTSQSLAYALAAKGQRGGRLRLA